MAYYNYKKESQLGTQKVWKNTTHDAVFSPFKNYYGIIEIDGKDWRFNYTGKFRSEALSYFEEQARLERGKFRLMSVYK